MVCYEDLFHKRHCIWRNKAERPQATGNTVSFPESFANRYEEQAQFLCSNIPGCLMQMDAKNSVACLTKAGIKDTCGWQANHREPLSPSHPPPFIQESLPPGLLSENERNTLLSHSRSVPSTPSGSEPAQSHTGRRVDGLAVRDGNKESSLIAYVNTHP